MFRSLLMILVLFAAPLSAQETQAPKAPEAVETPQVGEVEEAPAEPRMSITRLFEIINALNPEARVQGARMAFHIDAIPVLVVADTVADRMRAMVPIASAEGLSAADLMRMMQANFDSALDARYAVANGRLWAVYIHPLSPLEKDQFLSGLVQTVTVARTYGTAFSGGGAVFGGGDSNGIYRNLLKELQKKGQAL